MLTNHLIVFLVSLGSMVVGTYLLGSNSSSGYLFISLSCLLYLIGYSVWLYKAISQDKTIFDIMERFSGGKNFTYFRLSLILQLFAGVFALLSIYGVRSSFTTYLERNRWQSKLEFFDANKQLNSIFGEPRKYSNPQWVYINDSTKSSIIYTVGTNASGSFIYTDSNDITGLIDSIKIDN